MSANRPIFPSPGSFFIIQIFEGAIPPTDNSDDILSALGIENWSDVVGTFRISPPQSVFTSISESEITKLVSTAKQFNPDYEAPEFRSFLRVAPDPGAEIDKQLEQLKDHLAHIDLYYDPPGISPTGLAVVNEHYDQQGYLQAAPAGIDAVYAWQFAGGCGAGQEYIDLELGWTLDHEDLDGHGVKIPLYGSIFDGERPHGTRTLGVVSAINNDLGVVGVAADSKFKVVSYYNDTRPNAMLAAIKDLQWGSVLLIEAQLQSLSNDTDTFDEVPVELQPLDFGMIELATTLGITVIEAAGNGGRDLANVTNKDGQYVLDGKAGDSANHSDFKDSGAIMVGAARPQVPHVRSGYSNYGRRVDCFSWGDSVWTTTSNNSGTEKDGYTGSYSGTSSASAIVAGSALATQGIAESILGYRLGTFQMRGILGNTDAGTALAGGVTNVIGVQPDLRKILQDDLIGSAPDLYIRDNILDNGDPHSGSMSMSPDIIVLQHPVLDPQADFGEGSGTENSVDLSQDITAGADHFVYVRLRNRGATAITNAEVKIYWAPVSTLVTPDLWNLIGTANLASVPAADILTVSDAVTWSSGSIPGAGHYCFVAVASSALDPFPNVPHDLEWEEFYRLVRDINNVTWRNFNVVEYAPDATSPLPDYAPIDFMAYGDQHQDQMMDLEFHARLPEKSKILLEMPQRLFKNLSYRLPALQVLPNRNRLMTLNSHGAFAFKDVKFPKGEQWPCRLYVRIDEPLSRNQYQIYARQIFRENEVGRVTWMLRPKETNNMGVNHLSTKGATQMSVLEKIARELKAAGFDDLQITKATQVVSDNLPSRVYVIAVWFIGLITTGLVVGALSLMKDGLTDMDAVWVAVGAGLGALAGIFSSKN